MHWLTQTSPVKRTSAHKREISILKLIIHIARTECNGLHITHAMHLICLNKTHVICYTRRGANKKSLTIEDSLYIPYKSIYIVQPSMFNPCCGERGWHQSYFIKASHFLHWTYQT